MKTIQKTIKLVILVLLFSFSLNAADKDIALVKGWNQITVPFDRVKVDLLTADENIEVIWAYQNFQYNLATRDENYANKARNSADIDFIRSLSFGESLYVLAKNDTILTFVGVTNTNPPVRSEHMTSMWTQMSRNDFASTEWNNISKIVDGAPVIASKMVMKDGRPSLKVYSNDVNEASKINPEFFEDFSVGEDESFWIKDIANVSDIEKFDFAITQTPSKGGEVINFSIDAASTNKKRHYLSVKIVAIKDADVNNKEHVLYDDYVQLNQNAQEVRSVMPMFLNADFGTYRIYAIKDLAAQYDKAGIDIYNLQYADEALVKEAYKNILANSDYRDITIGSNADLNDISYYLKLESREYANSVLFYEPLDELNRIAKAQSKDLSDLGYKDIERHTEIQMTLNTYGHAGQILDEVNLTPYLTTSSGKYKVLVLSDSKRLSTITKLKNVEITFPDESHGVDVVLPLMFYGEDVLSDNTDLTVYNAVMDDLGKDENKICLDTECSEWLFKKEFELSIAVSNDEPQESDIVGKTTVTFYSDTFSKETITTYESKDTTLTLTNLLLSPTIYRDELNNKRVGVLGDGSGDTDLLISDLESLKSDLENDRDVKLVFDPLLTLETDLVDKLVYGRNDDGSVDKSSTNDRVLQGKWETYLALVGDANVCNRLNYYGKTVPYTKSVRDPNGGDDIEVVTATDDLCLYNVPYSHLMSLSGSDIEAIGSAFRDFILTKNTRDEEDRLADFWNPLFSLNNGTLHMPEAYYKKMPVIGKRIGGGAYFSSKMTLDSELNELRVNAYVDVDVALIKDFKLLDLDYETVISGSDPEGSRFDFSLYSINPADGEDAFSLKKIFTFHQQVEFTYKAEKKFDVTFAKGKSIHFQAGPVPIFFEFEVGVYAFFIVGVDLDMTDHFAVYAIPGARIFGSLAGGLGLSVGVLSLDIGIALEDFTVIRVAVPVVAQLDEFKLNKDGFSSVFKLFGDVHMRAAEITASIFVKIKVIAVNIKIGIDLFTYHGFDPLDLAGLPVGTDEKRLTSICQENYRGYELFCIRKELAIKFKFSGLNDSECKLLDDDYLRRKEYENDTTYLYSTNEYRKVRGCINDKYTFDNVSLDDWQLTQAQQDDIDNIEFWKWDSRALISHKLGLDEIVDDPYATPWADAPFPEADGNEANDDAVHEAWKDLTGFNW